MAETSCDGRHVGKAVGDSSPSRVRCRPLQPARRIFQRDRAHSLCVTRALYAKAFSTTTKNRNRAESRSLARARRERERERERTRDELLLKEKALCVWIFPKTRAFGERERPSLEDAGPSDRVRRARATRRSPRSCLPPNHSIYVFLLSTKARRYVSRKQFLDTRRVYGTAFQKTLHTYARASSLSTTHSLRPHVEFSLEIRPWRGPRDLLHLDLELRVAGAVRERGGAQRLERESRRGLLLTHRPAMYTFLTRHSVNSSLRFGRSVVLTTRDGHAAFSRSLSTVFARDLFDHSQTPNGRILNRYRESRTRLCRARSARAVPRFSSMRASCASKSSISRCRPSQSVCSSAGSASQFARDSSSSRRLCACQNKKTKKIHFISFKKVCRIFFHLNFKSVKNFKMK